MQQSAGDGKSTGDRVLIIRPVEADFDDDDRSAAVMNASLKIVAGNDKCKTVFKTSEYMGGHTHPRWSDAFEYRPYANDKLDLEVYDKTALSGIIGERFVARNTVLIKDLMDKGPGHHVIDLISNKHIGKYTGKLVLDLHWRD